MSINWDKIGVFLNIAEAALTLAPAVAGKSEAGKLYLGKISEVFKGLDPEKADKAITEWRAAWSRTDEMRLMRDVTGLITGKKITHQEAGEFMAFLVGLGPQLRKRFRDTYISETEEKLRLNSLVVFAKAIPATGTPEQQHAQRDQFRQNLIIGPGVFDPGIGDSAKAAVHSWAERCRTKRRQRDQMREAEQRGYVYAPQEPSRLSQLVAYGLRRYNADPQLIARFERPLMVVVPFGQQRSPYRGFAFDLLH
jgi:hypothetical protein